MDQSYVSGPEKPALLDLTVSGLLDRAVDTWPDREAVVSVEQGLRKTYSQVRAEADLLAGGLLGLGLRPGDRLGIWGPNTYQWYLTQVL